MTRRASGLAFITAAVTLFLQILIFRLISAKLLNNFAFLAISLTMLGFALSGIFLVYNLSRISKRTEDFLNACSSFFVLTTIGATLIFYHTDLSIQAISRTELIYRLIGILPYALLFTLPFFFSGLIIGTLLSSPTLNARRIYYFDLLGSAIGAFAVIPAIGYLGVETGILLGSGSLLVGTFILLPPRGQVIRTLATVTAVILIVCAIFRNEAFTMRYPVGSMLWQVLHQGGESKLETVVWDPISRIEVSRIEKPELKHMIYPSLIGSNVAFHDHFRRMITQNNYAFTFAVDWDGKRESLTGIEETIYSAAYHATSVEKPRVGIVGVGGGFDVLTALYFNASNIKAVEINAAMLSILQDRYRQYFASWVSDSRVQLVPAEGRHYLSTHNQRYDILQLSGVDSYSGTPGAANVFSENYLYTAEAFDLYLSRLTENGILNMMRFELRPAREMLRALVTAVMALRKMGVNNPAAHIVTLTAKPGLNFTALLVKRTPFTSKEIQRLVDWASSNPFLFITAAPGIHAENNSYQTFLSFSNPEYESAAVKGYPWDISPATDDRPFFFRSSYWWHIFTSDPLVRSSIPFTEYSIGILIIMISIVCLACIYVPLRYLSAQATQIPGTLRYGLFFSLIGLGYFAIEIALLQKYGLFLGHPNYSISVVLATLLCSTGIGSLLSAHIIKTPNNFRFVSILLSFLIIGEYMFIFPLLDTWINFSFSVRVLAVVAFVMPIGLGLGVYFPSGLERLKKTAPDYAPWAWGLNGIFSVLAPVLSVAFSMTWGINALLLSAIPIYLAAGYCYPRE